MTVIRNAERPGTFRVTWETVSEDSASMGDAEDRGWLDWGFRPVDDAEAALQTAIDVLDGKDVPFLNYFDTPKITNTVNPALRRLRKLFSPVTFLALQA